MTTFQGIAVATQSLRELAGEALRVVPGATVTVDRPEETPAGAADAPRLNISLLQVGFEARLRNHDLPTHAADAQVPLTLRYLFSFFGPTSAAQLMLGALATKLHEFPVLGTEVITRAEQSHPNLHGSGLDLQVPPVRIVPVTLTLEDLSRCWNGLFHMPYTLSTVYDVTPVVLSSAVTPVAAPPGQAPFTQAPVLPAQLDPLPPLTYAPGLHVPVSGTAVAAGLYVGLDGHWNEIHDGPDGLHFPLPDGVRAGTLSARLGTHDRSAIAGTAPTIFQLRPDVQRIAVDADSGELTVAVGPAVHPGQTATLSLHATDPAHPASATVGAVIDATTSTLTFPAPSLPSGTYLGILTIDGVASLPADEGGHYAGPLVQL